MMNLHKNQNQLKHCLPRQYNSSNPQYHHRLQVILVLPLSIVVVLELNIQLNRNYFVTKRIKRTDRFSRSGIQCFHGSSILNNKIMYFVFIVPFSERKGYTAVKKCLKFVCLSYPIRNAFFYFFIEVEGGLL